MLCYSGKIYFFLVTIDLFEVLHCAQFKVMGSFFFITELVRSSSLYFALFRNDLPDKFYNFLFIFFNNCFYVQDFIYFSNSN